MKSELIMAVNQICAEKDLPRSIILGAVEEALVHAYRRNYANSAAVVSVRIDADTGEFHVYTEKKVVESIEDPTAEMTLAEARRVDPEAELDATILVEKEPADFGRIAAQTAKQVILQRIHEAERDVLFDSFQQREGELINGSVQGIDYRSNQVTVTLGKKAEGILAGEDQLPNDRYRIGQNVRSLLAEVTKGTRGPVIRLSRSHKNMLRRLLEREVPEIYSGAVEIKAIAREPGQRSKVAVSASQPGVDPVGSCVGMRGTRIQNIVDELNGEKIDVVEWSQDMRQFVSNALSPARPTDSVLIEEGDVRTAIVVVPDRQLSLAIGKEGQNARLAAKLTGWRIDIKSETEAATEGLSEIKRQQLQVMRARALEAKAAAAAPDDLLSRAEWLLNEKDRAAVTLEQAARMLADVAPVEDLAEAGEAEAAPAVAPEAEAALTVAPATDLPAEPLPDQAPAAAEEPQPFDPSLVDFQLVEADFESEEGAETDDKQKQDKRKKSAKQRELVYDETLGQLVYRKKHKSSRVGWTDELEPY